MAQTNRLYFDNPMNFQLAPNEEHPEGQVVVVQQGWHEIPDLLKDHPLIKMMKPESEAEATLRQKITEAETARNEAVAKAEEEYLATVTEAEKGRVETLTKLNEERAKRMEERAEQGLVAYEPHPDPDAARAETLTLPAATHVTSAAGMAYKGSESVAAAQQRVTQEGASASTAPATRATTSRTTSGASGATGA